MLFRGYLLFFSGYAVASFLDTRGIRRREVKPFVLTQAYRLILRSRRWRITVCGHRVMRGCAKQLLRAKRQ
ncbi:MAG: hypothetical protein ACE5JD_16720 [Candidatus Methylomirabilia bacterium]